MKINSLFEVYQLYSKHLKSTKLNSKTDPTASIKTALIRYTLPGLNLPESFDKEQKIQFMRQIPVTKIKSLVEVQKEVYKACAEKGEPVPKGSQRTYRYALTAMLQWCEQQSWWLEQNSSLLEKNKETPKRDNRKVTDRGKTTPFALTLEEIRLASAKQSDELIEKETNDDFDSKPEWLL